MRTRPDPFGIPGLLGPSALDCSGLPRFCPLVRGERLSPSPAFLQANGQCPGAAPASVKEPCEAGFRSGPPPPRPVLAARRRTHHQATAVLYTIRRPPRNCAPRGARGIRIRSKEKGVGSKCGCSRFPLYPTCRHNRMSTARTCSLLFPTYTFPLAPCATASPPPKGEAVSKPLPQEDDLRFLSKRKGFRFSFAAARPSPHAA